MRSEQEIAQSELNLYVSQQADSIAPEKDRYGFTEADYLASYAGSPKPSSDGLDRGVSFGDGMLAFAGSDESYPVYFAHNEMGKVFREYGDPTNRWQANHPYLKGKTYDSPQMAANALVHAYIRESSGILDYAA